ncbi:hypothetical protein MNBD_GAMMA17-332 [hydrothermal vent metagenome]|uniref:DUF3179 domain-containing protein n=1 Tax=hydrothermal vent metagenome TaxID=652676 RepID=A0A3B0ZMM6_9ZZZZ
MFKHYERVARTVVLFSGKAKAHGMRTFITINDRLRPLLTPPAGQRTIVQRSHYRHYFLPLTLWLLATSWALNSSAADDVTKNGFLLSNSLIPADEILGGGPAKDGIPSIDSPIFVPANQATHLSADSRILGVHYNGISKAYPINILNWHEIVNDHFSSQAISVTFCPLCGTGIAYITPTNSGDFGVSGLLYNSDVLLYDRKTESLWSQIRAEAISGPLAGQKLTRIPISHTSWDAWRKRHPATLVLSETTGFARDYHRDPYRGYVDSKGIYFPIKHQDPRFHPKSRVIGITIDGHSKAYPFSALAKTNGNIIDKIGTHSINIRYSDTDQSAAAFDQHNNEIATITAFWFAWYAFHPETDVFEP